MSLIKSRNGNSPALRSMFTDLLDVDRFFENTPFFGQTFRQLPSVNITENDRSFEVEMAAPGLHKNDFKINLDNDLLTISAEHKEESKEEKKNYTRQEFSYQAFERSFMLPKSVNAESIQADYTNGILHLVIPKKEEAKKLLKEIKIS
ncbi:Hsp20/alpha crystallin family protein [Xanthocytophaga agilis]|uniref:Hsp20/alpha crystallin family protein n=1 Tax=Xanthocytophaga agilis TaxID=3048010 RepID=A0AAE3RD67_9BACT|nr:Hsp20/alpha crystallin family protein [Xanthocytophaga agilis]MDJ1506442.1 Hsp20/alpha crystallin family protein [Xanthocytophaga agilis]